MGMQGMEALRAKLESAGQSHLLDHWDVLTSVEQETLFKELTSLDLEECNASYRRCIHASNDDGGKLDDKMEPLHHDQCGSTVKASAEEKKEYERISYEAIADGKQGILLLAGGQGTRLGVAYPKGMYDVGLLSGKSLFQLQAERILKLERLAKAATGKAGEITWYIMTSASTVKPTKDFFEKHSYFGLKASNVVVFQQGTLPCYGFDGKILMSTKYELARAPDGNGGLYRALRVDGILDDMESRGIDYIQLYCVDNILVRVGDPIFTGYCISKKAECANKVVRKGFPSEAVGITCKVDGKYQVVEYSEITSTSAEMRNADGSLTYSAANICIHFFTREFLRRVVDKHEKELVHHVARKKIPTIDAAGQPFKPSAVNGIKMEKFVFDVFQFAETFVVWECVRQDEFEPLKNAEGASDFTPTHCRNALYALHQKFVLQAGGQLIDSDGQILAQMPSPAAPKEEPNNNNNDDDKGKTLVVPCEISPLVTYAGEGLDALVSGKELPVPCSQIGLH